MNYTATPYIPEAHELAEEDTTSLAIFRALSEHSSEGILVVNTANRKVVEANVVLGNLFNVDTVKLIGQTVEEAARALGHSLSHPGEFAEWLCRYLDIPESSGCFDIGLATESDPAVVVYITPIRNDRDEVVAKLCSFQDVSEQRALEQGLREAKQLETTSRLAAGIVHDSNNLLTVIIAQLYMAADQLRVETEDEDLIEPAMDAASKCGELLKTVLHHARDQVGQFEVLYAEKVLEEVEVLVRAMAPKNISIHTHYEAGLPRVYANPVQLQQVLMNLVFNAIDAMPDGGKLYIALTRQDGAVCLTVKDNGDGIPVQVRKQIFDAFYTTKEKGKGTGLGLHMVAGIVKDHRGTIHCESEPGAGTTFRVVLPTRESNDAGQSLLSQVASSQAEAVSS